MDRAFFDQGITPWTSGDLDNATFHKSQKTKDLIKSAGCEIIFLPPYSPDLNPIEKFWANLKADIRNNLVFLKSLADAIDLAFTKYST